MLRRIEVVYKGVRSIILAKERCRAERVYAGDAVSAEELEEDEEPG